MPTTWMLLFSFVWFSTFAWMLYLYAVDFQRMWTLYDMKAYNRTRALEFTHIMEKIYNEDDRDKSVSLVERFKEKISSFVDFVLNAYSSSEAYPEEFALVSHKYVDLLKYRRGDVPWRGVVDQRLAQVSLRAHQYFMNVATQLRTFGTLTSIRIKDKFLAEIKVFIRVYKYKSYIDKLNDLGAELRRIESHLTCCDPDTRDELFEYYVTCVNNIRNMVGSHGHDQLIKGFLGSCVYEPEVCTEDPDLVDSDYMEPDLVDDVSEPKDNAAPEIHTLEPELREITEPDDAVSGPVAIYN